MTKENSYLVSSPPFFLGLLLRAVGSSTGRKVWKSGGGGMYICACSNPMSLASKGQ